MHRNKTCHGSTLEPASKRAIRIIIHLHLTIPRAFSVPSPIYRISPWI